MKGWGGVNPCPFASRGAGGGGVNPCPFASREGLGGGGAALRQQCLGFRVIKYTNRDPAWRPSLATPQGCPSRSARACMVSLALDGAHSPLEREGWWAGLGFRV